MNIEIYETGRQQIDTFLKIAQGSIVDRFLFHVKDNNHIHMRFMDKSDVSLTTLDLKEDSQFKVIDCEPIFNEKPFALDVKDFTKMISYVKDQNILLSSEVSPDGELQGFNCLIQNQEGEIEKEIILPCYINEIKQDTPRLNFGDKEVNIQMDNGMLTKLLNEVNQYNSTTLELSTINRDGSYDLIFNATDDHNARKKIKIIKKSNKDYEIVDGKIVDSSAMYSLEIIIALLVTTSAYNKVNIRYGEQMPIIITYVSEVANKEEETLERTANLSCFLAPKVEQSIGQ